MANGEGGATPEGERVLIGAVAVAGYIAACAKVEPKARNYRGWCLAKTAGGVIAGIESCSLPELKGAADRQVGVAAPKGFEGVGFK